ncbi:hypothetical protein ACFSJS_19230 [Streptomyces desertarenae]|uniref:Uncharacterized protein n=1 Tax=Streptomyces desertarenae TaxID=2666184 RepID=A0ABW4PM32_9ACTN
MLDTGYETVGRPPAGERPAPDGAEGAGPVHTPCDLVTVPARQGLEAVDILRLREGVGPVLHDGTGDVLGFLVPPGTADGWDLPGSSCARAHRPGGPPGAPPVVGAGWLVPPESAHCGLTEPARLRAALGEAARTIAAADGRDRPRGRGRSHGLA